jgi:hypothetical protein
MTTHVVESTADTVRSGYLDPAASPVTLHLPLIQQNGLWLISSRTVAPVPGQAGQ